MDFVCFAMILWMYIAHIFQYIYCASSVVISEATRHDVCDFEEFHADCKPNEAVHVTEALFGHLRLSRCTPHDVNLFGCSANVIDIVDERCAGDSQCQIDMPDTEIWKTRPCSPGLPLFMDVQYVCIQGSRINNMCRSIPTTRSPSYLTSLEALRSTCNRGDDDNHVITLTADEGLKIELSVQFPSNSFTNHTLSLGDFITVEEKKANLACTHFDMMTCTYTSSDNVLRVTLQKTASQPNFVIIFVATGCLDYRPPAGMWQERSGDNVTVGCYSTDRTWTLECSGTVWNGTAGDCAVKTTALPTSTVGFPIVRDRNDAPALSLSRGVMLVTIIASTLVLCALVITAACVYIRCLKSKYHKQSSPKPRVQYALSPQDAALLLGNGIQDGDQRNSWHNTMPLPQNNDQHGAARKDYMTMIPIS